MPEEPEPIVARGRGPGRGPGPTQQHRVAVIEEAEEEPEMDMDDEEEMEEEMDETFVREYTEKVAHPSNSEEGDKASGPVASAKSKPHNGEAKPASSPGTAEKGMTPPKAAKQTKVAGNVDAKQSAV